MSGAHHRRSLAVVTLLRSQLPLLALTYFSLFRVSTVLDFPTETRFVMLPSLFLLLPCYLFLLPLSLANEQRDDTTVDSVRLYHRIFHPSLPQPLFYERASIRLAPNSRTASLVPSGSILTDLQHFAEIAQSVQDDGEALYQVALERDGDVDAGMWAISAVKAVSLIFPFVIRFSNFSNVSVPLVQFWTLFRFN